VSGYLLDTSAALIALSTPDRLRPAVRKAVLAGRNLLSVISYWEVLLKSMKGALDVGDPRTWWADALDQLAADPLLLRPEHITRLYELPPIHRDPFDRMLIAQAISEDVELVTTDRDIPKYAYQRLRVLS
jgi:PIN domain nuclease of toxin-antitoxin system